MNTRVVIVASSIIGALLVAVLIVGIVLVNTINAEAEREQYQDCMARYGFAADERVPDVSEDDLRAYVDEIAAAAEACGR